MENFMDALKTTLNDGPYNRSVTENGALGLKTTGKALLDLNFALSSLRNAPRRKILDHFMAAYAENPHLAIVWLFYARDARGGCGERRLFRVCMAHLAAQHPETAKKVLHLIAEYGRWDDLAGLIDVPEVAEAVVALIAAQLTQDMGQLAQDQPVSLLGKWLPSENTSSKDTRERAARLRQALGCTPREYRVMLSALRRKIDVTERKMSANQWEEIAYPAVSSCANLLYNRAFLRHDEERRREYLERVAKGEEKINASVLFPHDIVHSYGFYHSFGLPPVNSALEALWKALPNTVPNDSGTIVVADGSGSMAAKIGGTDVRALEVANALAIYFAERLQGPYRNRYITFSSRPRLVDLGEGTTLLEKLAIAHRHNEVANTNIEAVFDLILQTAIDHRLRQEEMPRNILIISDMEFDSAVAGRPNETLFQSIARRYAAHGYQLPRLVFWNVCSRTGTIPVKENALGVALVSGFSPNVAKMVMSTKLDPFEALLETLQSPRYDAVREALRLK